MSITRGDLHALYFSRGPRAEAAFNRLAQDHGRNFAELARDLMQAAKLIDDNEAAIKSSASLSDGCAASSGERPKAG